MSNWTKHSVEQNMLPYSCYNSQVYERRRGVPLEQDWWRSRLTNSVYDSRPDSASKTSWNKFGPRENVTHTNGDSVHYHCRREKLTETSRPLIQQPCISLDHLQLKIQKVSNAMPKVHLLDYVAGNIRSLVNAIEKCGYEVDWIRSPEDVKNAEVSTSVVSCLLLSVSSSGWGSINEAASSWYGFDTRNRK